MESEYRKPGLTLSLLLDALGRELDSVAGINRYFGKPPAVIGYD